MIVDMYIYIYIPFISHIHYIPFHPFISYIYPYLVYPITHYWLYLELHPIGIPTITCLCLPLQLRRAANRPAWRQKRSTLSSRFRKCPTKSWPSWQCVQLVRWFRLLGKTHIFAKLELREILILESHGNTHRGHVETRASPSIMGPCTNSTRPRYLASARIFFS